MWKLMCAACVACLVAGAAEAAPRQVRIIWNVGARTACVYTAPLGSASWWIPGVPVDGSKCPDPPNPEYRLQQKAPASNVEVEKGDYVSVFAVHYNPVSYKPRDPKALVVPPEEPEAIAVIDLITRVFRKGGSLQSLREPVLAFEAKPTACNFATIDRAGACLDEIQNELTTLQREAAKWTADGWAYRAAALEDDLKKTPGALMSASGTMDADAWLAGGAIRQRIGFNPDEVAAAFSCQPRYELTNGKSAERKSPLGDICVEDGFVERIRQRATTLSARLELFDISVGASCAKGNCVSSDLADRRRHMGTAYDSVAQLLAGDQKATWSAAGRAIASLSGSFATLAKYRRALRAEGASDYFVELPAQNNLGRLATVVFSLPLEGQDGGAQLVHQLTVKVAPDYPRVLASAGAMWLPSRGLEFRKLTINQVPATGSDGAPALAKMLQTTGEGGSIRPVAGLLATGVLVRRPVYATIGTTVDNNIFQTLMAGVSVFIPRWRSSIVAGALMSWGTTDEDLKATIGRYSVNGVALDGLDVSKVPVESRRHTKFVVGWTLSAF